MGSNPTGGLLNLSLQLQAEALRSIKGFGGKGESTARGFEPLRAEPNGFLVHHLNHSVTLSMCASLPRNKECLDQETESQSSGRGLKLEPQGFKIHTRSGVM